MQIIIGVVALTIYFIVHCHLFFTAPLLLTMQISAVVGADWGVRLRHLLERRSTALPLRVSSSRSVVAA